MCYVDGVAVKEISKEEGDNPLYLLPLVADGCVGVVIWRRVSTIS
jgi:hypothetical protein